MSIQNLDFPSNSSFIKDLSHINDSFNNFNNLNIGKLKIFRLKKLKYKSIWSEEEDEKLMNLTKISGPKKWSQIAENFSNKTSIQCAARYRKINSYIKKGKWSQEEGNTLMNLMNIYGKNWGVIAKIMKTRTSSQIRDKFLNCFDPNLNKDKFSKDEDLKIIEYYKIFGTDWNKINSELKKRTPNMIKSRFYTKLRFKYNLVENLIMKDNIENSRFLQKKYDSNEKEESFEQKLDEMKKNFSTKLLIDRTSLNFTKKSVTISEWKNNRIEILPNYKCLSVNQEEDFTLSNQSNKLSTFNDCNILLNCLNEEFIFPLEFQIKFFESFYLNIKCFFNFCESMKKEYCNIVNQIFSSYFFQGIEKYKYL